MTEPELFGRFDGRFEPVCRLAQRNLRADRELGLSLFVDLGGSTLLDLWGGFSDPARREAWKFDTIVNLWAAGGAISNLAALVLAEYGELDLDASVAHYWPEFAAAGKGGVLVRHVLAHAAGLPGWEQPVELADLYDWDLSVQRLAIAAPWWEPGTRSGYRALPQGQIVGELIRRITDLPADAFVAEQLVAPLEVDLRIGVPESEWRRVASIVSYADAPDADAPDADAPDADAPDAEAPDDDLSIRARRSPMIDPTVANTVPWRRAVLPGANTHGNARAVARVLSLITLGGEAHGVQLLSPPTIGRIFETQTAGLDLVSRTPARFGIGYALADPSVTPWLPDGRICFMAGSGGSRAVMDLDRGVTIVYAMNRVRPVETIDSDGDAYVAEIYRCLGA